MNHGFPPGEIFLCDYRVVTQHCRGCTLPVRLSARTRICCRVSALDASSRTCVILHLLTRVRSTRHWHGSSRADDCVRLASYHPLSCNAKLLSAMSCPGSAAHGGMNYTTECWGVQGTLLE